MPKVCWRARGCHAEQILVGNRPQTLPVFPGILLADSLCQFVRVAKVPQPILLVEREVLAWGRKTMATQFAPPTTRSHAGAWLRPLCATRLSLLSLLPLFASVASAQPQPDRDGLDTARAQSPLRPDAAAQSLAAPPSGSIDLPLIVRRLPPLTTVVEPRSLARSIIRGARDSSQFAGGATPAAWTCQPCGDRDVRLTSAVQTEMASPQDRPAVRRLPPLVAVNEPLARVPLRQTSSGRQSATREDARLANGRAQILPGTSQLAGGPIYLGPPPEPAIDNRALGNVDRYTLQPAGRVPAELPSPIRRKFDW
jgi:hypothetical protein